MIDINTQEEFNKKITERSIDGLKVLTFKNCNFNCNINLRYSNVHSVDFLNCTFKHEFIFKCTVSKNANFERCTFFSLADFSNSEFKEKVKVRFYNSKFNSLAKFDNTTFSDLADFWGVHFNQKIIFYKTDFLGTVVFSRTTFKENVLFTYSLFDKLVIFRGTIFQKGLDLSLAIISGELSPFDIKIKDFESNGNVKDEELYEKYVSNEGIIVEKNKRETFRILKRHFLNQHNSIDYLKFSSLEQKTYTSELRKKVFSKKLDKKPIQDYIILKLNFLSNNHGKSYLRAILFTLLIGLMFFYFSIIATENFYISLTGITLETFYKNVKYFFIFLTPTHRISFMDEANPKTFFYVWNFIGRIFISYGIYQTIQAFRKFKK
ncbi:hypothetical protein SAMN04487911_14813 [Arenibacter nanhaiticus]|uniref:Pentapeptide repeat-containing protein n=1 Tax=Arenibacter nanhaiticus TaxID=558155 RepID=A0A1M6MVA0_9FLAO|nr:pentapeptide repeat-containing protein [Arenibacter nanhaiticus]SHJ87425.1 hypothetical protein SAMN04487911_14813 [Arenibacter nanhaiticus]